MKKEPADHIGEKHGWLTIKDWKREGKYVYFFCECIIMFVTKLILNIDSAPA